MIKLGSKCFYIAGERGDLHLEDVDLENEKIASLISKERDGAYEISRVLKIANSKECSLEELEYLFPKIQRQFDEWRGQCDLEELELNILFLIKSYSINPTERMMVAEHTFTPGWILSGMLSDSNYNVVVYAAANKNVFLQDRINWEKHATEQNVRHFAECTNDMDWIKNQLINPSPAVLDGIGYNRYLTAELRSQFIPLCSFDGARGLMENPHLEAKDVVYLLDKYSHQEDGSLSLLAAAHKNLPREYQEKFAIHDSPFVRREIASRHDLDYELALKLAQDNIDLVRHDLKNNPYIGEDVLLKFAQSSDSELREIAGNHENSTEKVWEILNKDWNSIEIDSV